MYRALTLLVLAVSAMAGSAAMAATDTQPGGLPPWRFQMTPQEVEAFTAYGPYKSFRNGDLETYSGIFNGRKENVQFFFKEGKLVRIGIYLYEGQDIKAAAQTWGRAYGTLKEKFGSIELPDVQLPKADDELRPDAVASVAENKVAAMGKVQMAPFKQPPHLFVFASFWRGNYEGQVFYYVVVYHDPPHG